MKLVSDDVQRALEYLVMLDEQGYHPEPSELDAYVVAGDPTARAGMFTSSRFLLLAIGKETVRTYLEDVKWVVTLGKTVEVTALGKAVCSGLKAAEATQGEERTKRPIEVVLDPTDSIALSRLVERLAEMGDALLVDPYFRYEQLSILEHTQINRVLTTDALKDAEQNALTHALSLNVLNREVEVRMAKKADIHDRYVIPQSGSVKFIGGSISTIGKRRTVFGEIRDAADEIRRTYETVWSTSKSLGVTTTVPAQQP